VASKQVATSTFGRKNIWATVEAKIDAIETKANAEWIFADDGGRSCDVVLIVLLLETSSDDIRDSGSHKVNPPDFASRADIDVGIKKPIVVQ